MTNKANLEMFTVDYISGAMSLRKPQRKSLEILEDIFNSVQPCKEIDKAFATQKINSKYPIYKDFERDFMSLTFALATGVGKTRLMGAFIAYLYAQKGIKNFFVVAPGTTIYNKLRSDFGDVSNPKYVFKGLSCFDEAPTIIDDENYRNRLNRDEDINIFIFNIGKFDKEKAKLRSINEMLGESFYNMVSNLDDLVLLMDESHHYRAEKGMDALNALKPILGLELTATPVVTSGSKQVPFKNVVYEYPLKQSIADGYTRTPVALARTDLDLLSFGDEQWDKLMLEDGIKNHEKMKRALENYARKNNKPVVKPFMLVVCKDTEHAKVIENYIKSDNFCYGDYRDKTIVVTSKQGKVESDQNQEMLLNVEKSTNPVEIVIHVNMLKEGWDVNNLYTIVPLRTAASKVLREQMVGRGLRLPYGERTCNEDVDSVVLTAHNKFQEIMDEAIAGNSIFNQGNVITTDDWFREEDRFVQTNIEMELPDEARDGAYSLTNVERNDDNTKVIDRINKVMPFEVEDEIQISKNLPDRKTTIRKIAENTKKKISEDRDLGKIYAEHKEPFDKLIDTQAEKSYGNFIDGYIPIPVIKITGAKVAKQGYYDFDLDTSEFTHEPIESKAFMQRVGTPSERIYLEDFGTISFEAKDPVRKLAAMIRDKSDVDYDECSELLHKLILQVCEHYSAKYNDDKMKNIVMSNVRDISDKIYRQLQSHYYQQTEGNLFEAVADIRPFNIMPEYKYQEFCRYDDPRYEKSIKSVGFEGMKKSVFARVRFDSEPERKFAVLLEQEAEILRWLRPAPKEFQFSSVRKGDYDPDFIVATQDKIYMIEVKAEKEMNNPEVLRKRDLAVKYCKLASKWSKLNGYREWEYALIPDSAIGGTMTFAGLIGRYKAK